MKRKPTNRGCSCWKQINKRLALDNTELDLQQVINFNTGRIRTVMLVATRKIDSRNRNPLKKVICAYCPCCGKPVPTE